jgi:hypothetical protein
LPRRHGSQLYSGMGSEPPNTQTREKLARWVVISSLIATALMGIAAIAFASKSKEVADAAARILSLLLPVIGTWVGTVLAFYFARENFEAAARETRATLGERLKTPALPAAIPLKEIKFLPLNSADPPGKLTLTAIRSELEKIKRYRMPIFDEAKRPRWVVHQQPLDSFLTEQTLTKATEPAGGWTLADLLASPKFGSQVAGSVAVVRTDATLAQAKQAMEANRDCQDVFLTEGGTATDPVVAWLTNNEIQRAATV